MKKLNQSGLGAIEIILIVVIIGILGAVGWFVYDRNQDKNSNNTTTTTTTTTPTSESTSTTQQYTPSSESSETKLVTNPVTQPGYLVIKEWGVKIKMSAYDKVTYEYGPAATDDIGSYDSSVTVAIKSELLTDKGCGPGVALQRYKTIENKVDRDSAVKIGNYYFVGVGSPSSCENKKDEALATSIRNDLSNLEAF